MLIVKTSLMECRFLRWCALKPHSLCEVLHDLLRLPSYILPMNLRNIFVTLCVMTGFTWSNEALATLLQKDSIAFTSIAAGRIWKSSDDAIKSTEDGYALVGWKHAFDSSASWQSYIGIEAERMLGTGILREAWIGKHMQQDQLELGYIEEAQGRVQFVDIYNPWSPFFRKGLLWQNWGTGFRYIHDNQNQQSAHFAFTASAAANARESGFVQLRPSFKFAQGYFALTAGAVTYDGEQNDNLVRVGTEGALHLGITDWHGLAVYNHYLAYNAELNSTMVPGSERIAMLEMRAQVQGLTEFRALAEYRRYNKRYFHREHNISTEWLWTPHIALWPGIANTYSENDGKQSWFPRAILECPVAGKHAGLRLDAGLRDANLASKTVELQGRIWIDL